MAWGKGHRDGKFLGLLNLSLLLAVAKGRTNMELREKFILAEGASQSMAAFRARGRRSRPSSRGASPNRSTSVSNPPAQGAPAPAVAASTPKVYGLRGMTQLACQRYRNHSKLTTVCSKGIF